MVKSSTFANLTYDTLRREGKAVLRQLRQQGKISKSVQSEPAKRRIDEVEKTITEPGPIEDHKRVSELEALVAQKDEIIADKNRQIKSLKQQIKDLNAVASKNDEQCTKDDKQQKQVDALQQCISELSAIIASKDVLLAEASAHYDTLKERIRELMPE
ncbi:hypothetical protein PPTG_04874 [Phytophthora nicotianae INRA-310]|uniref:Uncharacterized protein n=1 Tax=Phytophthora nicotianae (strain INRA-310) TaxID=761204 RepID=W2R2F6_PHYN3|nr:hypothetical protein PPTG_04874 [Phytophthora nicotianae INRA-310]ETN19632.1 hypothetical protein PPTG_04874 [Phytophthora nicotianae INRA-310]